MVENTLIAAQPILSTPEALRSLGVTDATLTPAEKSSLLNDGYVLFKNLISPTWLAQLREAYERLMTEKYGKWHPEMKSASDTDYWNHETGTRRLVDLVSEDESFDAIYTNPKLLACARIV